MRTLREAKVGDTVRVVKLHGEGAVRFQPVCRELAGRYGGKEGGKVKEA